VVIWCVLSTGTTLSALRRRREATPPAASGSGSESGHGSPFNLNISRIPLPLALAVTASVRTRILASGPSDRPPRPRLARADRARPGAYAHSLKFRRARRRAPKSGTRWPQACATPGARARPFEESDPTRSRAAGTVTEPSRRLQARLPVRSLPATHQESWCIMTVHGQLE
jgi:hypothetical protein